MAQPGSIGPETKGPHAQMPNGMGNAWTRLPSRKPLPSTYADARVQGTPQSPVLVSNQQTFFPQASSTQILDTDTSPPSADHSRSASREVDRAILERPLPELPQDPGSPDPAGPEQPQIDRSILPSRAFSFGPPGQPPSQPPPQTPAQTSAQIPAQPANLAPAVPPEVPHRSTDDVAPKRHQLYDSAPRIELHDAPSQDHTLDMGHLHQHPAEPEGLPRGNHDSQPPRVELHGGNYLQEHAPEAQPITQHPQDQQSQRPDFDEVDPPRLDMSYDGPPPRIDSRGPHSGSHEMIDPTLPRHDLYDPPFSTNSGTLSEPYSHDVYTFDPMRHELPSPETHDQAPASVQPSHPQQGHGFQDEELAPHELPRSGPKNTNSQLASRSPQPSSNVDWPITPPPQLDSPPPQTFLFSPVDSPQDGPQQLSQAQNGWPNVPGQQPQLAQPPNGWPSEPGQQPQFAQGQNGWPSPRQASYGSIDEGVRSPKVYPQLHYHHQGSSEGNEGQMLPPQDPRGVRQQSLPDSPRSSSTGENGPTSTRHLTPYGRQSIASIARPSSAYSTLSLPDAAKGRSSPGSRIPSGQARYSPDSRPQSYVDLLNVPYPQPAPSAGSMDNTHLQAAVGSNASLLSHQKTLEMYRTNAKKTNDPSIQYEFALFMIAAAQEVPEGSDDGDSAKGKSSPKPTRDLESPYVDNTTAAASRVELLREARQILQRLSDRSYPFAQYYLADGYASGLFTKGKEDWDKAFPLFVAAGKHGHAEAGYRAALCYEFGWGSRKDYAKAVQFYRQSASKNHPGAMLRLGKACLTGDMGLGKRNREGLKWLKRATESADEQYNSAPYELGLLHETGFADLVFQDEAYAAQLYTQAAGLGHAQASYRMGDAYEHGKLSCPRDTSLSVHFYNGAAQHGHPMGMMALCAWYMVGAPGVLEKDENEAYEWARKAAHLGLAKAEYALGYFTEMGIGCRRDPLEANVWYVRAADQGDERAKHRLNAIRAAASGETPTGKGGKEKLKKSQTVGAGGKDDKECVVM